MLMRKLLVIDLVGLDLSAIQEKSNRMAKGNKYDVRVVKNDTVWSAEIVRRASKKKIVVSKSQGGFSSEEQAQIWAQKELMTFVENLSKRNKKHDEKRN